MSRPAPCPPGPQDPSQGGPDEILSLKKGQHGTGVGGDSVNGGATFRAAYDLPGPLHIPAPYTDRNPFCEPKPARLAQLCLQALEDGIAFQGAATIAAFIIQPILGAGGVIPPHPTCMPSVETICRKHGILLISDEVTTAFGRTSAWTGSGLWGVQPDFSGTVTAITKGCFPSGAVMVSENAVQVFDDSKTGTAAIGHRYTSSGYDLTCALDLVADQAAKPPAFKAVPLQVQAMACRAGAMVSVSVPDIILPRRLR